MTAFCVPAYVRYLRSRVYRDRARLSRKLHETRRQAQAPARLPLRCRVG